MTTTYLRKFYNAILGKRSAKPDLPHRFDLVTANPAANGSRGGIFVDQLISPGQLGRIEVDRGSEGSIWALKTSNILRFHLSFQFQESGIPHTIQIDGFLLDIPPSTILDELWFLRSVDGSWKVESIP